MEEGYIYLSWLNDYAFCPHSIYVHALYGQTSRKLYQETAQWKGAIAHESLDQQRYSTRKSELTGFAVLSEEMGLYGKIDLYKGKNKELIERKKKIYRLYDGYIYQLLGQYYCMTEMGYSVEKLSLYSMDDNKKYPVPLPDAAKCDEFIEYLEQVRSYNPFTILDNVNANKCQHCIYRELCTYSAPENG